MTANAEKVRASKLRRKPETKWTDNDRSFMHRYVKAHPRSIEALSGYRTSRSSSDDSTLSPLSEPRTPANSNALHTTAPIESATPDDFASIPTAPPPPDVDADPTAPPAPDGAPTAFVGEPDPRTIPPTAEQQAQIEQGANRAGAVMAGIATIGLDAIATFCELKGDAKRAEWVRSDAVGAAVRAQAFASGHYCAIKYGLAVVLPYEHELTVGAIFVSTAAAMLAVSELKKKGIKAPPRAPAAAAAAEPEHDQAHEPEAREAPIFDILRGGRS
jgi:hypothetical protein